MKRYICIHGHFYQPPRENPWFGAIVRQESASPFHDWNERITAECYAPNAWAKILDSDDKIKAIINNYAQISFNFGPTLLTWLEKHASRVYKAIQEADQLSQKRFSGHGSAIAQAYNHLIMPLANHRDKETQVIWGIRDFKYHFGREPEGMWLPETAVDIETLEVLAEHGIRFTILAPHQAHLIRRIGSSEWLEFHEQPHPTNRAYLQKLPSGRTISIFFYDGGIAQAVAFEKLLQQGTTFATRLTSSFDEERDEPQLVHIATDGETYGHHHHYGEMALAFALRFIEDEALAQLTNYGEFLERHPPIYEVQIVERTSWSCAHGVERWRRDCGCRAFRGENWHQKWRAPLREALDVLRDELAEAYERRTSLTLKDPWEARNDYISLILDRSSQNLRHFWEKHASHTLSEEEQLSTLRWLESQKYAMFMFTSCGWFFDEISDLETAQILRYAAAAIKLAQENFGIHAGTLERFLAKLEEAPSNKSQFVNGRGVFEQLVETSFYTPAMIVENFVATAFFVPYTRITTFHETTMEYLDYNFLKVGHIELIIGVVHTTMKATGARGKFCFAVIWYGDYHLHGGIKVFEDFEGYERTKNELKRSFQSTDLSLFTKTFERYFQDRTFYFDSLNPDTQEKISQAIIKKIRFEVESTAKLLFSPYTSSLQWLKRKTQLPESLKMILESSIHVQLRNALDERPPSLAHIRTLLEENEAELASTRTPEIKHSMEKALLDAIQAALNSSYPIEELERLLQLAELLSEYPFEIPLWEVQSFFVELIEHFVSSSSPLLPSHKSRVFSLLKQIGFHFAFAPSFFEGLEQ